MAMPMEGVENRILSIRGHRVMLDADLAELYGVPTKALNQAIKRNAERFPEDFMFQLSREEADSIRSQTVTLKTGAESTGNTVKMREVLATHKELVQRLDEMEGKYDRQFKVVFDAIRALMEPPKTTTRRIGY